MTVGEKTVSQPCQELEADLVLYYYGELSEGERRDCETHVKDCESCRAGLAEMGRLLPMTAALDEPPPAFWDDYSREMRRKLELTAERKSRWQRIAGLFGPVPRPALAAAALVLLVLTLTLGKGLWRSPAPAPDDESVMYILPMAEQLDFFSDMEVLDNLDLLEILGSQASGNA